MKITEYRTVAEQSARELDDEVNRLISRGYELYGNPYSSGVETEEHVICQAMVRIQSVAEGSSTRLGAAAG
jgi:hypothetical protein